MWKMSKNTSIYNCRIYWIFSSIKCRKTSKFERPIQMKKKTSTEIWWHAHLKKGIHKFYVRKVLEENLVTHERFDFITVSDYEGYVYIIHMFIWVFNKTLEPWKYFLGGMGGGGRLWPILEHVLSLVNNISSNFCLTTINK